jgi:hypothetical protein
MLEEAQSVTSAFARYLTSHFRITLEEGKNARLNWRDLQSQEF